MSVWQYELVQQAGTTTPRAVLLQPDGRHYAGIVCLQSGVGCSPFTSAMIDDYTTGTAHALRTPLTGAAGQLAAAIVAAAQAGVLSDAWPALIDLLIDCADAGPHMARLAALAAAAPCHSPSTASTAQQPR